MTYVPQLGRPATGALITGGAQFTDRILLGRIGDPEKVGRVVRFPLSEQASGITPSEIIVDGGSIYSQRT